MMNSNRLDENTLKYLVNILKKIVVYTNGTLTIRGGSDEFEQFHDILADGLYFKENSFINLFKKHKLSRNYLKKEIYKLLPILLTESESENYLNRCLIEPLNNVLQNNSNFSIIKIHNQYGVNGFTNVYGTDLLKKLQFSQRLYPHIHDTIGFFFCLITKLW